jgi:hypothetical protein
LLRGMHLRVRFGAICPFCMPLNNETIVVTSIPLSAEDKHYYFGVFCTPVSVIFV